MSILCRVRYRRKRSDPFDNYIEEKVSPRAETIPIRVHGADASTSYRKRFDFTTNIGEGAFGPVYEAQMATGQTVAVKVLATDSRQGAMEFHTEFIFNILSLSLEPQRGKRVGKSGKQSDFAKHKKHEPLSWNLRVEIALDVARGLEYLHYGAVPPALHHIKSSNILLDHFMKARVTDFGLSRLEENNLHSSNVKGTFGYVDPECMSTLIFTKKSDVYSFGVLLFEIMSGKNPQQGLMEYVELPGSRKVLHDSLTFFIAVITNKWLLMWKTIKGPSMRGIVLALSEFMVGTQGCITGKTTLLKQKKLLSNWTFKGLLNVDPSLTLTLKETQNLPNWTRNKIS
ncbi:hypothetical protein CRYUN_Cryun32bG0027500 [Craigia yunnanensis]